MSNPRYKVGDEVYLKTDRFGRYPLLINDIQGIYLEVIFLSINQKSGIAELKDKKVNKKLVLTKAQMEENIKNRVDEGKEEGDE